MVDSSTQTPRDENSSEDKEEETAEGEENSKHKQQGKISNTRDRVPSDFQAQRIESVSS